LGEDLDFSNELNSQLGRKGRSPEHGELVGASPPLRKPSRPWLGVTMKFEKATWQAGRRHRVDASLARHCAAAADCPIEPFIAVAELMNFRHGSDFADHSLLVRTPPCSPRTLCSGDATGRGWSMW
jgi:hypothetical protein